MPLGKRTDFGDARYAGLDVPFKSRVEDVLDVRSKIYAQYRLSSYFHHLNPSAADFSVVSFSPKIYI
jgi:hypothetical protein